ncbi:Receptor region transmembrane domain- and RING domain-containing protein 1 [Citrus sinensis]|nr:Receptor region transmembrane domain- and RING domain-containing protein 1 [Citrus sinensis]
MVPYYYISTSRGWGWGWGWGWGRRWHKGANSSGVYSREALDAPFCSSEICSNSQRAEGAKQESKMREKFLMKFLIIYLNLCFVVSLSSATLVWKPLSLHFPDLPAKFAVDVNSSGTCGALHVADPADACSPLSNPVASNDADHINFVLIVRGQCIFEDKIRNAQAAGYRAAIVYNDIEKGSLVSMTASHEGVKVHAIFVSLETGVYLKEHGRGETGECCIFPESNRGSWSVLMVSVFSLIVVFALFAVAFITPRPWRPWPGQNQPQPRRLDSKVVEALPCFLFSSASSSQCHGGETCAICLEDYQDGEKLKVLSCKHEFHASCVDSWLTKWGTFCPVCKHDMRNNSESNEVKRGN